MSEELVFLKCIKQGSKLRIKVISNGYYQNANCQFPRALRQEGRYYSVPKSNVRLSNTGATYFYRITLSKDITVLDEEPTINPNIVLTPEPQLSTRKRKEPESRLPAKIFENDDPDCVICLDQKKEVILSPCGHFCLCNACCSKLDTRMRKCPLCRQLITCLVSPELSFV